jgi:Flp pilus assembly protein TadG
VTAAVDGGSARRPTASAWDDDRGSVTAWLLLVPLLVLLLGGLTLDLWAALTARARVAAVADDAAAAGASAIDEAVLRGTGAVVLDPDAARARALEAAAAHPDAGLLTGVAADATPSQVTVTADATFEFLLLRLVGATTAPVSVTARAAPIVLD